MNAAQINSETTTLRTLADFGVEDLTKVATASYYVDAVAGRKITFRETSTVYFDFPDQQRRVVLGLTLETKKSRGKKVPVQDSLPRFRVSTLKGYDKIKNMWGTESHDERSVELTLEEANAFSLQFEEIRSSMVKEKNHWTWYPHQLAMAS